MISQWMLGQVNIFIILKNPNGLVRILAIELNPTPTILYVFKEKQIFLLQGLILRKLTNYFYFLAATEVFFFTYTYTLTE